MMRKIAIRLCLLTLFMLGMSAASFGQVGVGVSITFAPPAIPVYDQPVCPGDGYIWTPGYWAWDDDAGDYYWVPGTWVEAPEVGYLWTPGWWGWGDGFYVFHAGYWGPQVGFYGGINYGFGYFGHGFEGGRWDHDHFFYNREVNNVDVRIIHNVYEQRVDVRNENRVSYNGGNGGINERPTREEQAAEHERHVGPVGAQVQHVQAARSNPELRASANHGKPPVAATARPGAFSGREVVKAKEAGGTYNPPPNRGGGANARAGGGGAPREAAPTERGGGGGGGGGGSNAKPAVHPKELPPAERYTPPKTGNTKTDQKYQQQADKLAAQQERERQQVQQKQEQEHQRLTKQNAPPARTAQVEQKHQQQTQQLQQKHQQQQQQLQTRQQPRPSQSESKKK